MSPTWQTQVGLHQLLNKYRSWIEEGISDSEFSLRLRRMFHENYQKRTNYYSKPKFIPKKADSMTKWVENK